MSDRLATEKIEITKLEYIRLKVDAEILNRLEEGGVDNWEWYGESINHDNKLSMDEFEEELTKKLLN